jgi:methionyl-tRNA formyltransferase
VSASGNIAKIGFIGTGDWSAVFLKELIDHPRCCIETVLTTQYSPIDFRLRRQNILRPVYFNSVSDYGLLTRNRTDAVFMAGWPYKIPAEVIGSTGCPIINIHASLLPRYRGPEPIIRMLLHDEKEGGVTLHKVDDEWDAGPICAQAGFTISPADNNRTLFFKAGRVGRKLLRKVIKNILHDYLTCIPQDHSASSYFPKIVLEDYMFDESKTANEIFQITRAFTGQYPLIGKSNNRLYLIKEYKVVKSPVAGQDGMALKDGFIILEKYKFLKEL